MKSKTYKIYHVTFISGKTGQVETTNEVFVGNIYEMSQGIRERVLSVDLIEAPTNAFTERENH